MFTVELHKWGTTTFQVPEVLFIGGYKECHDILDSLNGCLPVIKSNIPGQKQRAKPYVATISDGKVSFRIEGPNDLIPGHGKVITDIKFLRAAQTVPDNG